MASRANCVSGSASQYGLSLRASAEQIDIGPPRSAHVGETFKELFFSPTRTDAALVALPGPSDLFVHARNLLI
jgi:hypothetical protein